VATSTNTEVIELTDTELRAAVDVMLRDAGVTLEELIAQGQQGRFDSELHRRTWFVVSGLGLA